MGSSVSTRLYKTLRKVLNSGFLLLLIGCIAELSYAAEGDLDPTFGVNGIVTTTVGLVEYSAEGILDIAIQSDGKIVAVGSSNSSSNRGDFTLTRYNSDGTLDASFGSGGIVITPFGNGHSNATAVAIQSDGKIVAAGDAHLNQNTSPKGFALARYNSNGTLDSSFATEGKMVIGFNEGNNSSYCHAMALQRDGKIVLAGHTAYLSPTISWDIALARVNRNGSLDETFEQDGRVVSHFANGYQTVNDIAIQSDGKILAVGSIGSNSEMDFFLTRYNTDGSTDLSFGLNGKKGTQFADSRSSASAVALLGDGRIIAAGSYNTFISDYDFALACYDQNGSLVPDFGRRGQVGTTVTSDKDMLTDIAVQSDGKIVAVGYGWGGYPSGRPYAFEVVRYNQDGSLDTSFGEGGIVLTRINKNNSTLSSLGHAVALQKDGKIVVGGHAYTIGGGVSDFALARYSASPVSLSILNATTRKEGSEGNSSAATFVITLSKPSDLPITVNYSTADGTGKAGSDYVAKSGATTFAPGQTFKTILVNFIGDSLAEPNDTFFLDLHTPVNATIANSRGKAFIGNDDGPKIFIDNARAVTEGPAQGAPAGTQPQSFTVRLDAASTDAITVDWATANGSAGPADYTVANGRLTFAPGETSKTITVLVKGDASVEPNEMYRVNLTHATFAVISDSQGNGYILNDDSTPGVATQNQSSQ